MSWNWVIDVRNGDAKVDWKWLGASLVVGLVVLFLLQLWLSGWVLAVVVGVLFVVGIAVDVMLRRERPAPLTPRDR